MKVDGISNAAFYDDKVILLTWYKPLREATVEDVFNKKNISVFKKIGDVDYVYPYADISLLHSRRMLCYTSKQGIPYEFNVDTRENRKIEIEQKVFMFSSLMGVDCGVKAVFQDPDNRFTYTLDWNNKVTPLHEVREGFLRWLVYWLCMPDSMFSSSLLRCPLAGEGAPSCMSDGVCGLSSSVLLGAT